MQYGDDMEGDEMYYDGTWAARVVEEGRYDDGEGESCMEGDMVGDMVGDMR